MKLDLVYLEYFLVNSFPLNELFWKKIGVRSAAHNSAPTLAATSSLLMRSAGDQWGPCRRHSLFTNRHFSLTVFLWYYVLITFENAKFVIRKFRWCFHQNLINRKCCKMPGVQLLYVVIQGQTRMIKPQHFLSFLLHILYTQAQYYWNLHQKESQKKSFIVCISECRCQKQLAQAFRKGVWSLRCFLVCV